MSRYRDDRDDEFYESRRGDVRSYAEQQFEEAQRRPYDYNQTGDDREQFNRSSRDERGQQEREQRARDDERARGMSNYDPRYDSTLRAERNSNRAPADYDASRRGSSTPDYVRGRAEYEALHSMSEEERHRDYTGTRFDRYQAERHGEQQSGNRYDSQYNNARDDRARTNATRMDVRSSSSSSRSIEPRERTTAARAGSSSGGGAQRSHVRCRDIMTRDVTVATRATTLQQVAAMMRDEDTGVIPVVEIGSVDNNIAATQEAHHGLLIDRDKTVDADASDAAANLPPTQTSNQAFTNTQTHRRDAVNNGKLIGLITDRDIVVRAIAEGKVGSTPVEEIMTTAVHTADPNDRVIDVIRKMGDKQVRRIPVVDREGHLRGIISMADIALETEADRELAAALEEISSGSGFWNKAF